MSAAIFSARGTAAIKIGFLSLWLALSMISIAPAQTLFGADQVLSNENGWLVYRNDEEDGCFGENRRGDVLFLLGLIGKKNTLIVGFSGKKFRFTENGKTYPIKLLFDGKSSWNTNFNGIDMGTEKFLFSVVGDAAELRRDIARSSKMRVSLNKRRLVTLPLKGTSALFKALTACQENPSNDKLEYANNLNNQAVGLLEAGKFAKAKPLFLEALAIREKMLEPGHPDIASSLGNLGILFSETGEYSAAEPLYRKALDIQQNNLGVEHPDVASILNNLGLLLSYKGDISGAEPLLRRALKIREKMLEAGHPDIASSLDNLASLLLAKGDINGAEPLYRKALDVREKALGAAHPDVGRSLNNLAVLLNDKGDIESAETLHRRALIIREEALGPDHPDTGSSVNNLATVLIGKGDLNGAEPLLRRVLKIREKVLGDAHPRVSNSLNNLAVLLYKKGDLDGAEPLHRKALKIRRKSLGRAHPDVGASLNNLANLLLIKGDYDGAEPLYREALEINETALGIAHPKVGTSLNNLAFLLRVKSEFAEALEVSRRAARSGHPRRNTTLMTIYLLNTIYTKAKIDHEFIDEGFLAVQQVSNSASGKALQSLGVRFSTGDDELAQLVRQEQDRSAELEQLNKAILSELAKSTQARSGKLADFIRTRIAELSLELTDIRKNLAQKFPEFAELSKPSQLKLTDVQSLLGNDEALIIIDTAGKGKGDDYVWAVNSKDADWQQLDTETGDIAKILTTLRKGLDLAEDAREPIDPALAYKLYQTVLGPVADLIKDKKHLLFVLNGAISSLPPQIFVTEPPTTNTLRDAAWLARDHAITILPTVSSLKLLRTQKSTGKAGKPFRGYGDPLFDSSQGNGANRAASFDYRSFFRGTQTDVELLRQSLPQLPGTARELISVGESLGAPKSEIVLGKAASEAAIKQDKLDDYRILYFATHGLVAGEVAQLNKSSAEPALAFSVPDEATLLDDGLLTASEVAQLKLNADWVVMSACNTAAAGKPGADALSGLARAFFYAGAKSLLVSHWVVDDDATAELMKRTFKYASNNPTQRGAESLRQAMLSLMNDPDNSKWADPAFWAPFVLVGEPNQT